MFSNVYCTYFYRNCSNVELFRKVVRKLRMVERILVCKQYDVCELGNMFTSAVNNNREQERVFTASLRISSTLFIIRCPLYRTSILYVLTWYIFCTLFNNKIINSFSASSSSSSSPSLLNFRPVALCRLCPFFQGRPTLSWNTCWNTCKCRLLGPSHSSCRGRLHLFLPSSTRWYAVDMPKAFFISSLRKLFETVCTPKKCHICRLNAAFIYAYQYSHFNSIKERWTAIAFQNFNIVLSRFYLQWTV